MRLPAFLLALLSILAASAPAQDTPAPAPGPSPEKLAQVQPVEPAAALRGFELPAGYRLELVASEPMIHEPAVLAWDGNGRMYCAEMRTYMQDIDGTGRFDRISRISLMDDTDGDGVVDRHTVFADGLLLPRMILTLEDSILIRETNTLDLWELRDTDGDGVADQKTVVYAGGDRGGNLEHQPSGLDWNLDNYLYVTYTNRRYRYRGGAIEAFPMPEGDGQWGMTHDDVGNLFYSRAGGEVAAASFQQNLQYGTLDLPDQLAPDFNAVWPIDAIPDVQGGLQRIRDDNTLNHFTACCGQVIYRGDRLPAELRGDLFIPEPVGRLIRRAKVTMESGVRVLSNAQPEGEFLRTNDPNFRPINMYTAPDGTLYIVDMYRGIIQEGNWVGEGSYLRGVVQEYGLDRNIGRGRIYRLVHEDFEPGPRPRMLEQTSAELVSHLGHPNGWWRDTAQKLLVLRGDAGVVPALEHLLATGTEPLARLHALWTLEGLEKLDGDRLLEAFDDPDARVRCAAVRISERGLHGAEPDTALLAALRRLAADPDPSVPLQVVRTAMYTTVPDHDKLIAAIADAHPEDRGITQTVVAHQRRLAREKAEAERMAALAAANAELAAASQRGKLVFHTLCFTCHGTDGAGAPIPGVPKLRLAPPLAGSPRARGSKDRVIRILLHGMMGPVDGVSYPGLMAPMAASSDAWIADALTYVRNSWGNEAAIVRAEEVAAIRDATRQRTLPWTEPELRAFDPALTNRALWKMTASHGSHELQNAVDGQPGSRWSTGDHQKPGAWLRVELPYAVRVEGLELDTRRSGNDYPRLFEVRASTDGKAWGDPIAVGEGHADDPVIRVPPTTTRFLEVRQTGESAANYWSVHELRIFGDDNPLPAEK